ncbi:exocyst subunit [Lecanora helva]
MSYSSNGYGNGSYGTDHYEEAFQGHGQRSGSNQHRAGGYGGFYNGDPSVLADSELKPPPPQSSFRRRGTDESTGGFGLFASGRRDTDDHDSSRSRERGARLQENRLNGSGPGEKQIEGVLDHINDKWGTLTQEDCVPVHIALQLMDYSSLGRGNDYQDFQKTNRNLQKSLKAIVNEHHQGFNSSIGTFHKIQASIQASQSRIRALRDSVLDAKSNLMATKPELKAMGMSSQKYDDMLSILGQIEKLQTMPEQLDARIADKHFLVAVDLLQDALRIIRKSEMENLGALTDLRIYFTNQETSLTDILIEELHDHVYLKSPYCQGRWKPYSGDVVDITDSENATRSLPNTWGRSLYVFLDGLDSSSPMEDDLSQNPETNSFEYMRMIVESLNKLGHLDIAIDRMEQRLPIELFAVVDRTNQEVELRHAKPSRDPRSLEKWPLELGFDDRDRQNIVITDLLWTLYSKFEAIAEGHRAVHEVVAGIIKREGLRHPDHLLRGFKEMWKLYQSEMRSLLHNYLATDGTQPNRPGRAPVLEGNVFHRAHRQRNKRVFKLSEVDGKSADLAADQRDLDRILQISVPGLVSKSQRRSGISHNDDSTTNDRPAGGHKLLVEPNVFNITSLLPPSLSFLQRLKDIVPHDSNIATSTLTSFLDESLVNVFYPQLEETLTDLCAQCFTEPNVFQQDAQWSRWSTRPIFKGTWNFFFLARSFCQLLDTIPPDLPPTQLIITQMVAYYDRCCEWYKTLVKRPQMQVQDEVRYLKTAAALVEAGDVRNLVESIWMGTAPELQEENMHKEVKILITKTNESPLDPFDIISDRRSVVSLCLIYCSMQWLADQLSHFRRLVPEKRSSTKELSRPTHSRQWSHLGARHQDKHSPVYLSMTHDTVEAFDSIVASIRTLGIVALLTLHVDIRLGIIHMLTRTLQAPYVLAQPAQEPDPSILSLNTDLLSFADTLSTHLPVSAQDFVRNGLALLIDSFLVTNGAKMRGGMNEHGCGRMQLNILVLSQNLKSIESNSAEQSVELDRSARFFDLFMEGADAIVAKAKDKGGEGLEGFSLEELKALIELWYRDGTENGVREVQVKSRRELSDRLLVLSECLWNR